MNKKQTIVLWIGAAFFVFFAWNPKIREAGHSITGELIYRPVFDSSFSALFGRLSATVVLTGLAVYTLRDKKRKQENKEDE